MVHEPATVNAYYNPPQNNINFSPLAFCSLRSMTAKLDDAVNFGGIGAVIGHELTHGFDDQGRQFDPKGNLKTGGPRRTRRSSRNARRAWMSSIADMRRWVICILNGKLTLGENVADNGGLRIAYMALMDTLAKKAVRKIEGYTAEQRLFLGLGTGLVHQPERGGNAYAHAHRSTFRPVGSA